MTHWSTESRAAAESVVQRLYQAVEHLATGVGDVRKRLYGVADFLGPLQPREFPVELRADFEWVMAQLTRYPAGRWDDGTVEATLKRIKNATGRKIAQKVFELYEHVQDIRGNPLL